MTDGGNGNGNGNVVGEALGKLSPLFKGIGSPAVDVEVPADQAEPVDEAEVNGRVYHDEHFNHGVHYADEGTAPAPVGRKVTFNAALSKNMDSERMTATTKPVQLGAPMPKWPANHQSAAFEAVSIKHSYILSPPEIFAECAHHGEEKYNYPWYKLWVLTIIAGCYVGFGYTTCLLVGGMLDQAPGVGSPEEENYGLYKLIFGAVGFPFGFTTIIVCGADLFTSLCAYMTAAWWEGKVRWHAVLYMLAVSWTGNFIGCAIMVGLMTAGEVYRHKTTTLFNVTYGKLEYGWGAVFVKGIFANWLVGIATWMANAAQDLTGKAVGIWLPISAFAMLGFEHSIANMFLFLMAWAMGANITAKQFIWDNLIPATLGNFFGGGVCLGTVYAFAYGRTPKLMGAWIDQKLKRS
ncbi:hypothetical protein CHLRE_07g335600v5 [Chlamydomonas reinhardtii]|uniref:NAR1.4 n=1 Tax=Chlamydomonas reinhardtii TaxID=3055 RepID=Q6IYG4_CHLRE|nr:uncharacterized protein CHLRE_07g335600v5 [Chlamydomonas reinhardtii]AAT39455.1 NAR1.4 [Chlamydomonas reinhardtii]PNW80928.1 hypothetical protein CHLRE_07g335600v5 [Chlamydomonas reinhardtii]|eukprot:XP_001700148.1 formate nitrite transporter [Chlamydomonas reinhardtii]